MGVRDVAERAAADQALINRYFGSKDGLITAALRDDWERNLVTALTQRLPGADRRARATTISCLLMGLAVTAHVIGAPTLNGRPGRAARARAIRTVQAIVDT